LVGMADNPLPRRRFQFPLWWLIPLMVLCGFALFGDKGVVRLWQGYQQRQELQAKVGQLQVENQQLRQKIKDLKNDRKTIESLARRELGMVRPDELVYQFTPAQKSPQTSSEPPEAKTPASLTPRSGGR